ncbi:MAG TPA: asparagine synthase (glutamine-hydrolyzing) [Vicinamibacterales bacterium]
MCGIAGVFGRGDRATVDAMLATLHHRGPDDGFAVGGDRFTLGARRLSIIDVEGGRQPMSDETGHIWAAQNGELYNYPQLRPRLLAGGHVLHTHCDTEILPHLYQEFDRAVPEHIDGMFAVAIWDDVRGRGLLARDRLGKKPLYYHVAGECLYFASELKALLEIPGFRRELNLEALSHYLSLKHVPHPQTIFQGVHILPPAHRLVFEAGKPPCIERYWDVSFAPDAAIANLSDEEGAARVQDLLKQGVERRLMSDVPIGFFLSGGLDSSLSTAIAAEAASGPIKTFTLAYGEGSTTPGKEADRKWARWVAERYGTDHHEETVAFTGFPESIRKILRCFDEPFAGVVSSYFLSQLIAQHVKVALSGDGADELFGSYRTHRLAAEPDARVDAGWRSQFVVFNDDEKHELFAPDVAASLNRPTARLFEDAFARLTAADPLNQVLEAELKTVFPDQVLTYGDRLSMAHSLEVRSAYLDTEFVEFAARLPARFKIRDGETKFVLKQVARKYFPAAMVDRPKEGFLMPVTQWFQRDLETYVRTTLAPERLAMHRLFRQDRVNDLIDRLYRSGSDYHDVNRVMALVIFQEWYELYLA